MEKQTTPIDAQIIVIDKTNQRKKYLLGGMVVSLLLAAFITIICVTTMNKDGGNHITANEAVQIFEDLANTTNITQNDDTFQSAFNAFDKDNDGYLDSDEFAHYYELKLHSSQIFELIDADNDDILSYPECVAYVTEMYKSDVIHEQFALTTIAAAVEESYGYQYNNISSELFIEYSAMVLFFTLYDIDQNGYIRHDEFIAISSQASFEIGDSDDNGKLNQDELFNLLYGTDDHSWYGIKSQYVGAEYVVQVVTAMHDIKMNLEMVYEVKPKLNLCPLQLYAADKQSLRRRLAIIIIIIIP